MSSGTWGDIVSTYGAVLISHRFSHPAIGNLMNGTLIVLENFEDGTDLLVPISHLATARIQSVNLSDSQFNWTPLSGPVNGVLQIHAIDVTIS